MALAAVGFAVMNACAKAASARVPFLEVASVRSLLGLPLLVLYARSRGASLRVHNRRVALVRVMTGTAAMGMTFYALGAAPLAEVSALLNLTPVFVAIAGAVWLRERVSRVVAGCLLGGLLGALAVFRPQGDHLGAGGLAAIGAALTSAVSMVTLRRLGATESPEAVVLVFQTGSGVTLGLLALPTLVAPTWREALLLAGVSLSATVGQLAMTRAYALDVAARVGGMNYLNIVASLGLAAVVFGERPGGVALGGIGLIVLSGALLIVTGRREAARAQ